MVIDDLLALVALGKKRCVSKIVEMCSDLHRNGRDSRFIKPLGDALYELKARTGEGGARVYFFLTADDECVLCHAECKKEDAADERLLLDTLDVLEAYERIPAVLT